VIFVKLVFSFKADRQAEVEAILNREPIVRQSILIRAATSAGSNREGNILLLEGTDEACRDALEALKGIAEELHGDEKEGIIKNIKEMEEKAMQGFGNIFS